jgi:hypothetical protein
MGREMLIHRFNNQLHFPLLKKNRLRATSKKLRRFIVQKMNYVLETRKMGRHRPQYYYIYIVNADLLSLPVL